MNAAMQANTFFCDLHYNIIAILYQLQYHDKYFRNVS